MVTHFLDEDILLSLTDQWLGPMKSRLAAYPIIRARLELLAEAREPFIEACVILGNERRRRLIADQLVETDERFDGLVRGIDALFEMWAHLGRDRVTTDGVLALRSVILPEGKYITLKSFSGEHGFGQRLADSLTEEHRTLMNSLLTIEGRTLLGDVEELMACAQRLGMLLEEQVKLKTEIHGQTISEEEAWERKKRLAKEIEKLADDLPDVAEDPALLRDALGRLNEEQARYRLQRAKAKELPPAPLPITPSIIAKRPSAGKRRVRSRIGEEGSKLPEAVAVVEETTTPPVV